MTKLPRLLLVPDAAAGTDTAPPPERGASYDEAFSAIDNISGDVFPETQTLTAPAAAAPEPAKPAEVPKVETPAAAPAKTRPGMDDLAKLEAKSAPKEEPKPAKAEAPKKEEAGTSLKQFREQYEMTKKERDELAEKVKQLEVAKAEGTRKEIEAATAALKKEMDDIHKRNEELDTEVRFLDYTKSREYRERFEEPLRDAWKRAIDDIDGITVTSEDGEERKASHHDILSLMRLPTGKAAVEAAKMFGPAAGEIMVHRRKLIELQDSRTKAIAEWKEKGIQRETQREQESQQFSQTVYGAFDDEFKATETEYSKLFGPEENDSEGNGLLDSAMKLIRLATRGEGLDESLSKAERGEMMARAQAQVALRARAFGRERLRTLRLEAKVKELEKKLADAAGSEPGSGSVKASDRPVPKSPEDAIDSM